MKKKRILFHPGPDQEPELLAELTLRDDGVVVGEFHDEATQEHLECGIFARGRRLQMSDGAAFFDGLDLDYARSSRISVELQPEVPRRTQGEGADTWLVEDAMNQPKVRCDWTKETLIVRNGVLVAVPKEEAPPPPAWFAKILDEHG